MNNYRKFRKNIENDKKKKCTFCHNMFYEKELSEVEILVGCTDVSTGFLCTKCLRHPLQMIRRVDIVKRKQI